MSKSYRLLIVDDNQDILSSFYEFFTSLEYRVVTAVDGLDALKKMKHDKEGFQGVITDLVMPNISGVGLISIVKKEHPDVKVIAMTGWGDHPGALASEADADMVLYKPVDLFKIESLIKNLIEGKDQPE